MADIHDRYVRVETKRLPNGRIVYRSMRPKSVIVDPMQDVSLTATSNLRADILAHNAYGSAEKWWKLVAANGKFAGSLFFGTGETIYLPSK